MKQGRTHLLCCTAVGEHCGREFTGKQWESREKDWREYRGSYLRIQLQTDLCVCVCVCVYAWVRVCQPKPSQAGMKNEEALKEPGVQNMQTDRQTEALSSLPFECEDSAPIHHILLCVKVSDAVRGEISLRLWCASRGSIRGAAEAHRTCVNGLTGSVEQGSVELTVITTQILHPTNQTEMSHKATLHEQQNISNYCRDNAASLSMFTCTA